MQTQHNRKLYKCKVVHVHNWKLYMCLALVVQSPPECEKRVCFPLHASIYQSGAPIMRPSWQQCVERARAKFMALGVLDMMSEDDVAAEAAVMFKSASASAAQRSAAQGTFAAAALPAVAVCQCRPAGTKAPQACQPSCRWPPLVLPLLRAITRRRWAQARACRRWAGLSV